MSRRRIDAWTWAALAVGVLGIALRLLLYLRIRPLWVDEAMLANNVLGRSWSALLRPLASNQAAPPGFLLLLKGCSAVFGPSEASLRLVPLLFGLVTVPLVWLLARRTIGPVGAFFATSFVAFHPPLVYYASELKQYSVDACVAVAVPLVWLTLLPPGERATPHRVPRTAFGVCVAACVLAPWLSHSAVFVVAGCCAAASTLSGWRRDWGDLRRAAVAGIAFAIGFGIEYVLVLRPQSDNAYLQTYWQGGFVPWQAGPWGVIEWTGETYAAAVDYPLFQSSGLLVFVVGLVGLLSLWRTGPRLAAPLLWTFAATLAASAVHAYPLRDRLLLWCMPLAMVVLAAGVAAAWPDVRGARLEGNPSRGRGPSRVARVLAIGVGLAILAPMLEATFAAVRRPDRKEDLPAVLAYVSRHAKPGDTVYVYPGALPAFRYEVEYRGAVDLSQLTVVEGRSKRGDEESWQADISRLDGRTWFVFSHVWNDPETGLGEDELVINVLRDRGRPLDVYEPAPDQVGFDRAVALFFELPSM